MHKCRQNCCSPKIISSSLSLLFQRERRLRRILHSGMAQQRGKLSCICFISNFPAVTSMLACACLLSCAELAHTYCQPLCRVSSVVVVYSSWNAPDALRSRRLVGSPPAVKVENVFIYVYINCTHIREHNTRKHAHDICSVACFTLRPTQRITKSRFFYCTVCIHVFAIPLLSHSEPNSNFNAKCCMIL